MSNSLDIGAESDLGLVPYAAEDVARYRHNGWWSGRTLSEELVQSAGEHESRRALVTPEVEWTYDELFTQSSCFAAGLKERAGLQVGDPVMFQMGNVAETVVAYLGCLLAGGRPVCTLPTHGMREIGLLAEHVGARLLISQADFRDGRLIKNAQQLVGTALDQVILARGDHSRDMTMYESVLAAGEGSTPGQFIDSSVDPLQVAVFQLSGGTTGLPKVAARLHEEYAYNSRAWANALDYGLDTSVLYPFPLMHNAGISLGLQPTFLTGGELVLAPSAHVESVLDLARTYRPNMMPLMVPAFAVSLLETPGVKPADVESLHDVVVGGQKLPVEIAERLRDYLGIHVRQMFGMAEGMFFVTPKNATEYVRHHTVGAAISPGDEVRVVSPATLEDVPSGELGELIVRGPYTIKGYYRADEHNAAAFTSDGFYRTGDLAQHHDTAEGSFYSIEGRIKDVINRGVEKIHAEEVEEIIVQHPSVVTAALVAMPDRQLGEKACAFVVMEEGSSALTVETLGQYLLEAGLAKFKFPERVEVVDELPLANVGKVSKKDLRARIEQIIADEEGRTE